MKRNIFCFCLSVIMAIFLGCDDFVSARMDLIEESFLHTSSVSTPEFGFGDGKAFIVTTPEVLADDPYPFSISIPIGKKKNPYARTVLYRAAADSDFAQVFGVSSPESMRSDFIDDKTAQRDTLYVYKIAEAIPTASNDKSLRESELSEESMPIMVRSGLIEDVKITEPYWLKRTVTWNPVSGADYYIIYRYYYKYVNSTQLDLESPQIGYADSNFYEDSTAGGAIFVRAHFPEYGGYEGIPDATILQSGEITGIRVTSPASNRRRITWNAVSGADYYVIYNLDDSYNGTVVESTSYEEIASGGRRILRAHFPDYGGYQGVTHAIFY